MDKATLSQVFKSAHKVTKEEMRKQPKSDYACVFAWVLKWSFSKKKKDIAKKQAEQVKKEQAAAEYRAKSKKASLKKASVSRQDSKIFGGKALSGSAKQKSCGETLRKAFLSKVTVEQAEQAVNAPIAQTAKFWIETEKCTPADILACINGTIEKEVLFHKNKQLKRGY